MAVQDDSSVALIPSAYGTSKVYSVIPSNGNGDFTFSRSGNATRVNKGGYIETMGSNVPRLDYPLIDGEVQDCPALLLEPSRQNRFIRSEEFDNSTWIKTRSSIIANQVTAPNGTQTADELREDTQTGAHYFYDIDYNRSDQNTFSIFAKYKGNNRGLAIGFGGTSTGAAFFNLRDGVIETNNADRAVMIKYPNEWYRCVITEDPSTTTDPVFYIYQIGNATDTTYTGDGSSGIYIWGAQAELASYETSYIPTTSTLVTRSADACYGSGTSAEFNDSEGVLFLETSMLSSNPNNSTFQIDDGTSTNRVRIRFTTTTNQINGLLYSGVSGQPNINYTANDVTNQNKVAIRYQVGQIDLFFNGFEVGTSTGNATPTGFDNLSLGTEGNVKQTMTFKTALTDSELETLTSWDSFNAMAKGQLYTIE